MIVILIVLRELKGIILCDCTHVFSKKNGLVIFCEKPSHSIDNDKMARNVPLFSRI
jgi:hypothetical protein